MAKKGIQETRRPETRKSDVIRWAVPDDSAGLAEVTVSSWQEAYSGILSAEFLDGLDRPRRATWWRQFLEKGARVNVTGDPVIGYCHVGDSADSGWGEVFAIYVHPDHWGEGLGLKLFSAGEERLRDLGHDRALLWVLRDNVRAREFYERQGWRAGKPIRIEEIGGVQVTEVRYETEL